MQWGDVWTFCLFRQLHGVNINDSCCFLGFHSFWMGFSREFDTPEVTGVAGSRCIWHSECWRMFV